MTYFEDIKYQQHFSDKRRLSISVAMTQLFKQEESARERALCQLTECF